MDTLDHVPFIEPERTRPTAPPARAKVVALHKAQLQEQSLLAAHQRGERHGRKHGWQEGFWNGIAVGLVAGGSVVAICMIVGHRAGML